MNNLKMNTPVVRAFGWTGAILVVTMAIALVPLMRFIPPPKPSASADEIATMFRDNTIGIRLGLLLMMISFALILPWAVSIAVCIRQMEDGIPILTYSVVACGAASFALGEVIGFGWAVAAFRPDDVSPEITRAFNDLGWFAFLWSWPITTLWPILIAIAVFADHHETPVWPRWMGYYNLWTALLEVPGSLMIFFKTGPFAFNGAIAFYFPMVAFGVWLPVMTWAVLRACSREQHLPDAVRQPATV